jgi:hypothetical protein
MKTKITLMLLLIGSFSFTQINIKTPDLEKKAKEKLEKQKEKKEKEAKDKIEKEKKDKKDKVEDKVDEKTDLDKKTSNGNTDIKTVVEGSQYVEAKTPKVNTPTLEFYADAEYTKKLDVVVPGETDVFGRVIFPKSITEEIQAKQGNNGNVNLYYCIELTDDKGDKYKINAGTDPRSDTDLSHTRELRFLLHGTKKTQELLSSIEKDRTKFLFRSQKDMYGDIGKKLITYVYGYGQFGGKQAKMSATKQKLKLIIQLKNSEMIDLVSLDFDYEIKKENYAKMGPYSYYPDDYSLENDYGMSTELHKNNASKIVFSNLEMDSKFNDASKLKSSFNLSEKIFGQIYLKESIYNTIKNENFGAVPGKYFDTRIIFAVNGKEHKTNTAEGDFPINKETSKSLKIANFEVQEEHHEYSNAMCLAYLISELPAGTYTIKMMLKPTKSDWKEVSGSDEAITLAEGEFKLTFTVAERDAFVKKYGKKFPNYTATTDQTLIALLKKKYLEHNPKGSSRYYIEEPKIIRNSIGIVLNREGYFYVVEKDKNGDYQLVQYYFIQQFVGNKWENNLKFNSPKPSFYLIPIQNHK